MNEILVPGAKDRADLIEKLKAALQTCNLCEDKIVMEFPDGMWGDEFRGIVQSVMPEIEANLERHGGYMCDAENFSITGQNLGYITGAKYLSSPERGGGIVQRKFLPEQGGCK